MKSLLNPLVRLSSVITAAAVPFGASALAVDYIWDGGTGNWNATNWNGATASGPTTAGNTATINSGNVTVNVGGPGNVDSITLGSGSQLNLYNGDSGIFAYGFFPNLILQGGTVNGGSGTYNAYGASILTNVTVNGSAASTITSASWFNIDPTTTFTVADATGDSNTDLLVSTSLRGPAGSPDWTYNTAKIIKEGAGTMEVTVHSYFRGGLDLNGGTLRLSGGNGGYGFFDGTVNVNSGTTLSISSDGTGLGWQGDWKPDAVNINGGTITTAGANHIWGISGGVNMTGGTLQSNNGVSDPNGAQLEWNNTNLNTNASGDTATVGGRIRMRADGGYGGISFNVANGAAATDLLVSAAVTEASGGLGVTKTGDGTMVMSGTNNYTGATSVSAGTLLVTGALGSTNVSVNGGAIGGTGTVGGSLTISSGFFHVADLGNALDVAGTINLFAGFGIDDLAGVDWVNVGDGTYTLINGSLGTGVFSALSNNSLENAFSLGGGRSAYFQEGSLQLVVIPEPRATLLGAMGLFALFRRRRA
ncbi:MAG: autotransporter-associated beta strand repeat-containing protein [Akkermansiaceae bacterium]|nr:autotransporter-associated beta strand repeat-containing protein [Akkermansiaceae bacterium]